MIYNGTSAHWLLLLKAQAVDKIRIKYLLLLEKENSGTANLLNL